MQSEYIEKHIFSGISDYFRLSLTPLHKINQLILHNNINI